MYFEDEPEWMRKARTIPVRSKASTRDNQSRLRNGQGRNGSKPAGTVRSKK